MKMLTIVRFDLSFPPQKKFRNIGNKNEFIIIIIEINNESRLN